MTAPWTLLSHQPLILERRIQNSDGSFTTLARIEKLLWPNGNQKRIAVSESEYCLEFQEEIGDKIVARNLSKIFQDKNIKLKGIQRSPDYYLHLDKPDLENGKFTLRVIPRTNWSGKYEPENVTYRISGVNGVFLKTITGKFPDTPANAFPTARKAMAWVDGWNNYNLRYRHLVQDGVPFPILETGKAWPHWTNHMPFRVKPTLFDRIKFHLDYLWMLWNHD